MPRLSTLFRRSQSNEESELSQASRRASEMAVEAQRAYFSPSRGYTYNTPILLSDTPQEPTGFDVNSEYPEDTPDAIRIRLANLEDIDRGLEQERVARDEVDRMYRLQRENAPEIIILRPHDELIYGNGQIYTADINTHATVYRQNETTPGYRAVMNQSTSFDFNGNSYMALEIRFVPETTTYHDEMGGTPFHRVIASPPNPWEHVYYSGGSGQNVTTTGGGGGTSGAQMARQIPTDVGMVLPYNTVYGVSTIQAPLSDQVRQAIRSHRRNA